MAELATQLMRASEQACLCFLEANASAKLDTPKRLDVVVRVALHDRGGAVLDEARSSALGTRSPCSAGPGHPGHAFWGRVRAAAQTRRRRRRREHPVLVACWTSCSTCLGRRYGSRVRSLGTFFLVVFPAQHQRLTFCFFFTTFLLSSSVRQVSSHQWRVCCSAGYC